MQVAKSKALTKALLSKKKPPRVPTLHSGMAIPHSPPGSRLKSRLPFSPSPYTSAADLRVAFDTSPNALVQLPLRYKRLMQQFEWYTMYV